MKNLEIKFDLFEAEKSLNDQRHLFADAFPETRGTVVETAEFYSWKFRSTPSARPALECAAWGGPHLLGYYAGIQLDYNLGSELGRAAMVCDVMTHSKARGAGVFGKLGAFSLTYFAEVGIDFTLGYPVRPEVFPGHYKVGWKKAFELPVYVRPIRVSRMTNNLCFRFFLSPFDWVLNALTWVTEKVSQFFSKINLRADHVSLEEFCHAFESGDLLAQAQTQFPNYLKKTQNFFQWRLSAPGSEYDMFLFRNETSKVVGWAIGRRSRLKGLWFWSMLDYYIADIHKSVQTQALSLLCRFTATRDVVGLATMVSRSSARHFSFTRAGLIRIPYKFSLIYKNLSSKFSDIDLSDERKWNLMWIDSDDL